MIITLLFTAIISTTSFALKTPWIETYWESWVMEHSADYASTLQSLPVSSTINGINIVDISFSNYAFSTDSKGRLSMGFVNEMKMADGSIFDVDKMIAAVDAIHQKGGLVKISFGGATFSMSTYIKNADDAKEFAKNVAKVVEQDHLDGIDFDVEDSTSGDIQIAVIQECRKALGKDKLISYTLPATGELHEPYKTILSTVHSDLDAVNVMAYDVYWSGYDPVVDFESFESIGVDKSQIVWGIMPGCHDASNEFTHVSDAKNAGNYVASNGLAGVMMWDINRDTNHRSQTGCLFETGQPDGTYLKAVSQGMQAAMMEMEENQ